MWKMHREFLSYVSTVHWSIVSRLNGSHPSPAEKPVDKGSDEDDDHDRAFSSGHLASDDKPKNEPMDTNDAQMSLGSDGIIISQEKDSKSVPKSSPDAKTSPTATNTRTKVTTKASYAFSQPTTEKFEAMLAKIATSPHRQAEKKKDENVTVVRSDLSCHSTDSRPYLYFSSVKRKNCLFGNLFRKSFDDTLYVWIHKGERFLVIWWTR